MLSLGSLQHSKAGRAGTLHASAELRFPELLLTLRAVAQLSEGTSRLLNSSQAEELTAKIAAQPAPLIDAVAAAVK